MLSVAKGSKLLFETTIGKEEVPELQKYKERRVSFFRDWAVGTGLKKPPLLIPDLAKPETFAVGDRVTIDVAGSVTVGLAVDAVVRAGVAATVTGDFELTVKKVDNRRMAVVAAPMEGATFTTDLQLPFLRGFVSKEFARALRQEFIFDLGEEAGRKGYHEALRGNFPQALADKKASLEDKDLQALAYYWAERQMLPKGVQRGWCEIVRQTARKNGLEVGLILAPIFAVYKTYSKEKRLVTNGNAAYLTETRTGEWEQKGISSAKQSVSAELARQTTVVAGEPLRRFHALTLESKFSFPKAGRAERQQVLESMRKVFGVDLEDFAEAEFSGPYDVSIQRPISIEELLTLQEQGGRIEVAARSSGCKPAALQSCLANVRSVPYPSKRLADHKEWLERREQISREAAALDLPKERIESLLERVEHAAPERNAAFESILAYGKGKHIQDYAIATGEEGLGALHRYLSEHGMGDDAKLVVRVSRGHLDGILHDVRALRAKYTQPIACDVGRSELNERLKKVRAMQDRVEEGIRDIHGDVIRRKFCPEETKQLEQEFIATSQLLREMVQFEPGISVEQRRTLLGQIDHKETLQTAELLAAYHHDLIRDNGEVDDVRARFEEIEPVIERLVAEKRAIKRNPILSQYEEAYQRNRAHQLKLAKRELEGLLSVGHLTKRQRERLLQGLKARPHLGKLPLVRLGKTKKSIIAKLRNTPALSEHAQGLAARVRKLREAYPDPIDTASPGQDLMARFEYALCHLEHVDKVIRALEQVQTIELDDETEVRRALASLGDVRASLLEVISTEHLSPNDRELLLRNARLTWPITSRYLGICDRLGRA